MSFLTKKEAAMVSMISGSINLSQSKRTELISEIKHNARLRSDGYKGKIKTALYLIATMRNESVFAQLNTL